MIYFKTLPLWQKKTPLNFREESRKQYTSTITHEDYENPAFSMEQLRTGALLRIADATEKKMAYKYAELEKERNQYQEWYRSATKDKETLYRRISALQGVVTRMKNKNRKTNQ